MDCPCNGDGVIWPSGIIQIHKWRWHKKIRITHVFISHLPSPMYSWLYFLTEDTRIQAKSSIKVVFCQCNTNKYNMSKWLFSSWTILWREILFKENRVKSKTLSGVIKIFCSCGIWWACTRNFKTLKKFLSFFSSSYQISRKQQYS